VIDWDTPIQSRGGDRAVLLEDGKMATVAVRSQDNWSVFQVFGDTGQMFAGRTTDLDIINVPKKHRLTGWLNVYPGGEQYLYSSRYDAPANWDDKRIAFIDLSEYDIEYEEGEGL